jgi:hypothetical protein
VKKMINIAEHFLGFVSPILDSIVSPIFNWVSSKDDAFKWTKRFSRAFILLAAVAYTIGLVGALLSPIPGLTPAYLAVSGGIASQLGCSAVVAGIVTGILTIGCARVVGTTFGSFFDYVKFKKNPYLSPSDEDIYLKKEAQARIMKVRENIKKSGGVGCAFIQKALAMMFVGESVLKKKENPKPIEDLEGSDVKKVIIQPYDSSTSDLSSSSSSLGSHSPRN